jgi:Cu/Ag efflux pump CusA
VYVQSEPEFRRMPSDLDRLFVENEEGEPVPYSAFMSVEKRQGLNEITRYNVYPSSAIQGAPAKGYSSGDAINAIEEVAAEVLPRGYDIDWAGLAFDEVQRGNEAMVIFLVVVVFVYLVLVGQYESFLLPLAVILSLPVGVLGSFLLLKLMGLENNVYAQVALVMLVGLLGKNAILIVEFAVQKHQQGMSVLEAAIEGARGALPADPDDVVRLYRRPTATGVRLRRRRHRQPHHRRSAPAACCSVRARCADCAGSVSDLRRLSEGKKLLRDESESPISELLRVYGKEEQQ